MNVESVIQKIASERNKKGYSFENMAVELDITPAAYRKIEIGETKLTVDRLFKISNILDVPISDLLNIDKDVLNQHNHDNEMVYQQKIDNFFQENREVYEKLIQAKDEQIFFLKSLLGK